MKSETVTNSLSPSLSAVLKGIAKHSLLSLEYFASQLTQLSFPGFRIDYQH